MTLSSGPTGQFLIQNVVPQASGESAKVKVKVRFNVHGVFSITSASLIEVLKPAEGEEPMETEQTVKEEEVGFVFALGSREKLDRLNVNFSLFGILFEILFPQLSVLLHLDSFHHFGICKPCLSLLLFSLEVLTVFNFFILFYFFLK